MPYPPVKTENYHNIGGVNRKASPYMTGTNEVIDILNFDYTVPGAYTVRPGSTQWLSGISAVAGFSGGVVSNFQSVSVDSVYQFNKLDGASFLVFTSSGNLIIETGTGYTNLLSVGYVTPTIFSFTTFVDYLFMASLNGSTVTHLGTFKKFSGRNTNFPLTAFSLPPPDRNNGLNQIIQNNTGLISGTSWATAVGMTGVFVYGFAWKNERGYIGPVSSFNYNVPSSAGFNGFPGIQFAADGASFLQMTINSLSFAPNAYGISYLVIFRAGPLPGYVGIGSGVQPAVGAITNIPAWYDLATIGMTTAYIFTDTGTTVGPDNQTGNTLGGQQLFFTLFPSLLNVYNNALFMGGFGYTQNGISSGSSFGGALPSTFYFSAVGEPELVGGTQSAQVRTNDGDIITGFHNYISQQIIFKNRSFNSLTGTDSTNYQLSQISSDYGCISNRAVASFNQLLWFLDRKGICQYDGANVSIISNRVEPTFRSMNLAAAEQTACMIHVKDRNEVWTAIPINGATFNNHIVIYDYVANAFTEWSGPQVASLGLAFDPNQVFTPIYGDYSGMVSYFNPLFFTDNNRSFTCSVTPRYFGGQNQEMGYSVEKMFRRAYFDITDTNNTGQTTVMSVNLISDFGSSQPVMNQTFAMATGHTQARLDFGIPGKAASFQLSFVPQTSALNFNGYTIEYRYQRNV